MTLSYFRNFIVEAFRKGSAEISWSSASGSCKGSLSKFSATSSQYVFGRDTSHLPVAGDRLGNVKGLNIWNGVVGHREPIGHDSGLQCASLQSVMPVT